MSKGMLCIRFLSGELEAHQSDHREDLLLSKDEQEAVYIMRKALNGMKSDEAVEQILNMFARTANNAEFVQMVKKQKL